MDLKKLKKCKGLFHNQTWYENESFAKLTQQPSWRLIRKTPVENSLNKSWEEQQSLLNHQTDEIPLARQVIYTTFFHFLATGEQLFKTYHVRTDDIDSVGDRIIVGIFVDDGINIYYWDDSESGDHLGLASVRKAEDSKL